MDTAEAGRLGGVARAANLSPKVRKAQAQNAIRVRWDKWRKLHPQGTPKRKKAKAA